MFAALSFDRKVTGSPPDDDVVQHAADIRLLEFPQRLSPLRRGVDWDHVVIGGRYMYVSYAPGFLWPGSIWGGMQKSCLRQWSWHVRACLSGSCRGHGVAVELWKPCLPETPPFPLHSSSHVVLCPSFISYTILSAVSEQPLHRSKRRWKKKDFEFWNESIRDC